MQSAGSAPARTFLFELPVRVAFRPPFSACARADWLPAFPVSPPETEQSHPPFVCWRQLPRSVLLCRPSHHLPFVSCSPFKFFGSLHSILFVSVAPYCAVVVPSTSSLEPRLIRDRPPFTTYCLALPLPATARIFDSPSVCHDQKPKNPDSCAANGTESPDDHTQATTTRAMEL